MSVAPALAPDAAADVIGALHEPTDGPGLIAIRALGAVDEHERFRRNVIAVSLVCLTTLAAFYTLYAARAAFMPIAMALVLKLLLNPGVRLMAKAGIPPLAPIGHFLGE